MVRNYLKVAWRNLLKHTTFSVINILGLAIGITACLVIFIYVQHELTFDRYNVNADRIARVTVTVHAPESDLPLATSPVLLADALQRDYPEVASAVRFENSPQTVAYNNDFFAEKNFYKTDQSVFSIFSFDFVEGSAAGALEKPGCIVITSTIAKKYFGTGSAAGKTMTCNGANRLVTAVIKDRPSNSDMQVDALLSNDFSTVVQWMDDLSLYTFVLFKRKPDLKNFERKLAALSKKYIQPELNALEASQYSLQLIAEPLADVHFSQGKHTDMPKGNRQYNYVFSILSIFILVIALLNYINLSTAKATERAKEVGIRKVSGALPFQLIRQFLFESFFLITIAWIFSIVLVWVSLPLLNNLLQVTLTVNWAYGILFTGGVFLVTFLLAGLYPAFVLSAFKPVQVLKGNWRNSGKGLLLRKAITITQFAIAAALIMGTTVIYNQLHFIEQKDLGFNRDQLLNIYLPRDSVYQKKVNAFQHALRRRPEIQDITIGGGMVQDGITIGTTLVETNGKKRELMCNYYAVDPHFLPVFQIKLAEGRNLSDSFGTDKTEAFLVNEAFVKMMGWKSGVGRYMEGFGLKGKIVGVVKNFYYRSLHNLVEPMVMVYKTTPISITTVKLKPGDLPLVKKIFKEHFPTIPMDYSFFDEIVNKQYEKDRITMSLFNDFTVLAIFVSCLGLYGLVALIAAQRTKEIGIRKVLGASLPQLVLLLTKDFMKLVFWALIISLPVAGILMNKWLSSYAYHVTLNWWMFLLPALSILLIALAVISKEIIKTALINPVKTLRTE